MPPAVLASVASASATQCRSGWSLRTPTSITSELSGTNVAARKAATASEPRLASAVSQSDKAPGGGSGLGPRAQSRVVERELGEERLQVGVRDLGSEPDAELRLGAAPSRGVHHQRPIWTNVAARKAATASEPRLASAVSQSDKAPGGGSGLGPRAQSRVVERELGEERLQVGVRDLGSEPDAELRLGAAPSRGVHHQR